MADRPTPRQFPAASEISPDALDKLLEALATVVSSVDALGKKVDAASREASVREFVVEENIDEVVGDVKELDERVSTTERHIRRHDAGFKSTSDVDAKHESELAALVIAIDETRKLAKHAATEIDELKKNTKLVVKQGERAVTALAKVDQDAKKGRVPLGAATALNLAIGLVYLILKLLERH